MAANEYERGYRDGCNRRQGKGGPSYSTGYAAGLAQPADSRERLRRIVAEREVRGRAEAERLLAERGYCPGGPPTYYRAWGDKWDAGAHRLARDLLHALADREPTHCEHWEGGYWVPIALGEVNRRALQETEELQATQDAAAPIATDDQWRRAKEQHPGMMLLCRAGDGYEARGEDAAELRIVCGIQPTMRAGWPVVALPMADLEQRLGQLLKAGRRVAVCEVEDAELDADDQVDADELRDQLDEADATAVA